MSSPDEWARNYQENELSQKASIGKAARRRSKKPSMTLLNANPSNFRALVQKFTGCQSASTYKGPINLNFGQYKGDEGYESGQLDESLLSFSSKNIAGAIPPVKNIPITSDDHGRESFISTVGPLSFDDLEFWSQDYSGLSAPTTLE